MVNIFTQLSLQTKRAWSKVQNLFSPAAGRASRLSHTVASTVRAVAHTLCQGAQSLLQPLMNPIQNMPKVIAKPCINDSKLKPNQRCVPKLEKYMPNSFKRKNGQFVCSKKNDHPHKSGKNPRGHVDRQCCLDPDEIPNPWCTY